MGPRELLFSSAELTLTSFWSLSAKITGFLRILFSKCSKGLGPYRLLANFPKSGLQLKGCRFTQLEEFSSEKPQSEAARLTLDQTELVLCVSSSCGWQQFLIGVFSHTDTQGFVFMLNSLLLPLTVFFCLCPDDGVRGVPAQRSLLQKLLQPAGPAGGWGLFGVFWHTVCNNKPVIQGNWMLKAVNLIVYSISSYIQLQGCAVLF